MISANYPQNKYYLSTNDGIHTVIVTDDLKVKEEKNEKYLSGESIHSLMLSGTNRLIACIGKGIMVIEKGKGVIEQILFNKITSMVTLSGIPDLRNERYLILRTSKRIKIVDMFKKSIVTVHEEEKAEKDGNS